MRRSLACLYGEGSLTPFRIAQIARANNTELIFVANPDGHSTELIQLLRRLADLVLWDGVDRDGLFKDLRAKNPTGIITFSESELDTTCALAGRLGLPYNDADSVQALTSKGEQRRHLAEAGIAVPKWVELTAGMSREQVDKVVDQVSLHFRFPVIVKPMHGAGSRNTIAVEAKPALANGIADIIGSEENVIVEEMLVGRPTDAPWGDYIGVDCLVTGSEVSILFVTGKFSLSPPFRERGGYGPRLKLSDEDLRSVCECSIAAIKAMGATHGIAGVELKLTTEGPRVIEVNGRLGAWVDGLANAAKSVDPGDIAVKAALGIDIVLEEPVKSEDVFFDYAVNPPLNALSIANVGPVSSLRRIEGVRRVQVHKEVGDTLNWRQGAKSIVASVAGAADDLDSLPRIIKAIDEASWIGYVTTGDASENVGAENI